MATITYGPASSSARPATPTYALPSTGGGFNINPSPQGGQGAFGAVPGVIGAPPSIFDELNQNVPNYGALTKTATGAVGSELAGQVNPATVNMLQDAAASRGISSGAGAGSGFANNNFLQNLGLNSEALTHHGITDYGALTGTLGATQQQPELLTSIAEQNAVDASAPNPADAQSYAQQLFQQYLNPTPAKNTSSGVTWTPAGAPSYFSEPEPV